MICTTIINHHFNDFNHNEKVSIHLVNSSLHFLLEVVIRAGTHLPFGHLPFGTLAMRQLPFGTLAIRESCHSTYLPFGTLAIRDTCHSGHLPFEDTCHSDTCHSKTLAIQKLAIQDTCHSGYLPFKTLAIWARKFKLAVKRQFFICFRTDYDKD